MRIEKWERNEYKNFIEVSANIDEFRLWYRVADLNQISQNGDPFLAAALLPAMLKGEELEIDPSLTISPRLLKNIRLLQEIHHCWNPKLKIIPISAKSELSLPINKGAISFFSGGVDSMFTLMKQASKIKQVVFIQGFDFYINSKQGRFFTIDDVSDLSKLACRFMECDDEITIFLRNLLSAHTRQALSNYLLNCSYPNILEEAIIKDLNKVINGPSLYDEKRFSGIQLSSNTKEILAEKSLPKEKVIYLNKKLLEGAFPGELAIGQSAVYENAIERNSKFVRMLGKKLISVETNHYPFGYRYNLSRNLTQGSALASIALLLGYSEAYIPASWSYKQLLPLGSHPLTDPLYSNEATQIIHDGAEAMRADKISRIAENKIALENLRVCFNDMNHNCGKCAKCIRTMIPLELIGTLETPFPRGSLSKIIKKRLTTNNTEMIYFEENYELSKNSSNKELKKLLESLKRSYDRKKIFRAIMNVLLSRLHSLLKSKITKSHPGLIRVDTTCT